MSENANERLVQLESYAMILRGLISYHKRMMLMGSCYIRDPESGKYENCKIGRAHV